MFRVQNPILSKNIDLRKYTTFGNLSLILFHFAFAVNCFACTKVFSAFSPSLAATDPWPHKACISRHTATRADKEGAAAAA